MLFFWPAPYRAGPCGRPKKRHNIAALNSPPAVAKCILFSYLKKYALRPWGRSTKVRLHKKHISRQQKRNRRNNQSTPKKPLTRLCSFWLGHLYCRGNYYVVFSSDDCNFSELFQSLYEKKKGLQYF